MHLLLNRTRLLVSLTFVLMGGVSLEAITFGVDPAVSHLEVQVRATGHNFTSQLKTYQSNIQLTPDGASVMAAQFSFRFSDLDSGNEDRDAAMLEWIGEAPPIGQFKLKSVRPALGRGWIGVGDLTLWRQTRPVEIPFQIVHEGGRTHLRGELTLDYTEYGLPKIRKFAVLTVFPTLHVVFDLVGSAQN